MEIKFQTKEESKRIQREEFLKLKPADRFLAFLKLSRKILKYPTTAKDTINKDNFILRHE